jgi:HK97 family phage major capsid protein
MAESDKIKALGDGLVAEQKRSLKLAEAEAELGESRGRQTDPEDPAAPTSTKRESRRDPGYLEIRVGKHKDRVMRFAPGTDDHRRLADRNSDEYRDAFRNALFAERRALQSDLDTAGGNIAAPEVMLGELLANLDDPRYVRGLARKFTVTGEKLGTPVRTAKMVSAAWGAELSQPTEDTTLAFGKTSLTPHYITSLIKVSKDLLRNGAMDVEGIVMDETARDQGELEEKAVISGTGAGQPLGLFTASALGISTSRDVSTNNTTTAPTMDGLINAYQSLKAPYRARATWMFHRDCITLIRKFKDSANYYIWQPAQNPGQPDRILNAPVVDSEYVPNTFTTGLYCGIIGDFNYYWVVDRLMMDMQVLVEQYALTNQVGYLARRQVDGMPVREEAFARVKLG